MTTTRTERIRFVAYSKWGVEFAHIIPITLPEKTTARTYLIRGEMEGMALLRDEAPNVNLDALRFDTYLL